MFTYTERSSVHKESKSTLLQFWVYFDIVSTAIL
jgi:hypothetical protein